MCQDTSGKMQDMAEPEDGLAYTAAFDRFYTGFAPWYDTLVRLFRGCGAVRLFSAWRRGAP